jgi:dolichol-phosphate mannosyltransferase
MKRGDNIFEESPQADTSGYELEGLRPAQVVHIDKHFDLSVIIPADNEADNLANLMPQVHSALIANSIIYEIIVSEKDADERTREVIGHNHARLCSPSEAGYGAALSTGFQHAVGDYIVVMDADQANTGFLRDLWDVRNTADVIIASRYIPGGQATMPMMRTIVSKLLNGVFSRGLDLRVRDMSNGFRLYKSQVVKGLATNNKDYDILQEILVMILMAGHQIREIPFTYISRNNTIPYVRIIQFGLAYLKAFARLWRLRNSIASADYDTRAYDALVPPQRYWQRQRYKHITQLLVSEGKCLDVGCGSSRIIEALPPGSVALDILFRKLRFARRYGRPTIQGSIFDLPVTQNSFPCVICSQVIEHVPRANVLSELDRVLQPDGLLILGTPDYAKWQWQVIEWLYKILLPQAYADEHITHYTKRELIEEFVHKRGYTAEAVMYILQGELILGLRKPTNRGQ